MKILTLLPLLLVLAACSTASRIAVQAPAVTDNIPISFRTVEVRDVSLPAYAAADELSQQAEDGTIVESNVLWADTPERAVALQVSENLSRLTRARVASEPWPFEAYPQARLTVRFSEMIAGTNGVFRISGQYFVANLEDGPERSGLFDLTQPYDVGGGPSAIARARGQIILDLSKLIAREGLR